MDGFNTTRYHYTLFQVLITIGYLAKVQCVEVLCPMTKEFFKEYLRYGQAETSSGISTRARIQQMLYVLIPRKFRVAEYLIQYHSD